MFTTIMYCVINEVTRQPAAAKFSLSEKTRTPREPSATRSPRKSPPVANTPRRHESRPGTYQVLAESFKRAAGFR
jgi:hypothetical protein